MREKGYYWCLTCHGWKPVEWIDDSWHLEHQDTLVKDDWFSEIDERRIVRNKSNDPDLSIQAPDLYYYGKSN